MTEDQALAVVLTWREANHLVRLVTDRRSRTLRRVDREVSARIMNSLAGKGMAEVIDGGWRLTDAGRTRSTIIY